MYEGMSYSAARVAGIAQAEARELLHTEVDSEHILLGLLHPIAGEALEILSAFGVTLINARQQIHELVGVGRQRLQTQLPVTPGAQRVYDSAIGAARVQGFDEALPCHILASLVAYEARSSVACQALVRLDVPLVRLAAEASTAHNIPA